MKPDPLTIAEHVALGAELHQIRLRLMEIHVDVAARYGNSKGVTDRARRAADALDRLRCDLDSQFCRDHPDAFFPQAYYPGATMPDTDTPAAELVTTVERRDGRPYAVLRQHVTRDLAAWPIDDDQAADLTDDPQRLDEYVRDRLAAATTATPAGRATH